MTVERFYFVLSSTINMAIREIVGHQVLSEDLEVKSAQEVLAWALEEFHPRIALAASFGAEDVVLIDMLAKLNPTARVFTLDTGRLPYETYALMEAIRERYGLVLEVYFPGTAAVEAMVRERCASPWWTGPRHRPVRRQSLRPGGGRRARGR